MNKFGRFILVIALPFALAAVAPAQVKKPRKPGKIAKSTAAAPSAALADPPPVAGQSHKRNERPAGDLPLAGVAVPATPAYSYEFTRPGFVYSRILIEHDLAGKGRISFVKDGFDELITDPVSLSPVTLATINDAITSLAFLASAEDYQTSRDYSHMGNTRFTLTRDGKTRTVKYNWTENKNAKILMDEYRRIANEYTWRFEISVGRENQPLETPGQMDKIDSYVRRGEISDPPNLLPFLTELSTDERLPLMARNQALKLIKIIEKNRTAGK
ncbi:MAG: hypothetical protein WKF34_07875 [Pyrinomonadaceae bacterium]